MWSLIMASDNGEATVHVRHCNQVGNQVAGVPRPPYRRIAFHANRFLPAHQAFSETRGRAAERLDPGSGHVQQRAWQ